MNSGYTNFDDPRLVPSWVYESQDVTPTDCYETCAHAEACRMQLARLRGWDVAEDGLAWMETLANDLGCGETCDQYDEDEAPALRRMCTQLVKAVGESEISSGLKADLRKIGIANVE